MSTVLDAAAAPAPTSPQPVHPLQPGAATSDGISHGRRDLPSLTGLRWVAALLVFVFHSAGWGIATSEWFHWAHFGFVGVAFFFVLSGVVLTWSARPGQGAGQFYWRRFARIYPSHFVTGAIAIVLYLFVMPPHKALWAGLLALALLHAWVPIPGVYSAANGVSWSLSCEAFFYALFPGITATFARVSRTTRLAIVAAVLTVCSTAAIFGSLAAGGRYDTALYMSPAVRAGEFVLGVALGLALREGWVPRVRVSVAWAATAVAVAAALWVGWLMGWPVPRGLADVLTVGPLALVLVAYAGRDLTGRPTLMAKRWAVYLGQISFAFYLVHQLVLDLVLKRLLPMTHPSVVGLLQRATLALVLSLFAAMALHHLVELPGQRLLTRKRRRSRAAPVAYPSEGRAGDSYAGESGRPELVRAAS